MAATEKTAEVIDRDPGCNIYPTAANADGNFFTNTGREFVHLKKSTGSVNVTFAVTKTVDDLDVEDLVVAIEDEELFVGPFPTGIYNDDDEYVQMSYSAVTNLEVEVVGF